MMVEVLLGEVGLGAESVLTLENKALHTFLSRVLITWPRSQVQVRLHTQHCYLCARAKEQNVGVSDKGVGLGLSLLVLLALVSLA